MSASRLAFSLGTIFQADVPQLSSPGYLLPLGNLPTVQNQWTRDCASHLLLRARAVPSVLGT